MLNVYVARIRDLVSGKGQKGGSLARQVAEPLKLPSSTFANGVIVKPGMGTFVLEGAGSSAQPTGVNVYFQRQGAPGREPAPLAFQLAMGADMKPRWDLTDPATADLFDEEVFATVQEIMDELDRRDPTGYLSQVVAAMDREIGQAGRERQALVNEIGAIPVTQVQEIAEARARLAERDASSGPRIARLTQARLDIREWLKSSRKESVEQLIARTIGAIG